ncbi:40S ribosomal protein S12 isoform X1 [Myotis lucifugus]|uniref:40S ribosomal protein S12 isoform X1 n=1 Tax=Myotis lucifugus TaxID=59463 RepID=UPI000CCC066D|nr:40S ribosomal protein S12 isoform X1 [Myotis lucifugus]
MAEEGIAAGGVMDVNTALQEVLKTALIHDGLARGIREAAKALDKRQAHLCVLASNCDEPMYVKLVEALCAEHQINLIKLNASCRYESHPIHLMLAMSKVVIEATIPAVLNAHFDVGMEQNNACSDLGAVHDDNWLPLLNWC